jgi:hypothetical protein
MFYLTKRVDEKQCTIGERCMVLADFSGIKAGTKGRVCEIYERGVVIQWEYEHQVVRSNGLNRPQRDGFSRDELEYLAFETRKHPKVDPKVNRSKIV